MAIIFRDRGPLLWRLVVERLVLRVRGLTSLLPAPSDCLGALATSLGPLGRCSSVWVKDGKWYGRIDRWYGRIDRLAGLMVRPSLLNGHIVRNLARHIVRRLNGHIVRVRAGSALLFLNNWMLFQICSPLTLRSPQYQNPVKLLTSILCCVFLNDNDPATW